MERHTLAFFNLQEGFSCNGGVILLLSSQQNNGSVTARHTVLSCQGKTIIVSQEHLLLVTAKKRWTTLSISRVPHKLLLEAGLGAPELGADVQGANKIFLEIPAE